jgi:hypothetical protein
MSVAQLPLEDSFLARDGFRRALTGTGIGMGALAANGQAAAVAATPVTTQVHQSLHIHGHFAPEVAFDLKFLVDCLADPHQFVVGEVVYPPFRGNADILANLCGRVPSDAVNIREGDYHPLRGRNINASDTRQSLFSLNFGNK